MSSRFRRLNYLALQKNEFLLIQFFSPIFHIVHTLYLFIQSYEMFYFCCLFQENHLRTTYFISCSIFVSRQKRNFLITHQRIVKLLITRCIFLVLSTCNHLYESIEVLFLQKCLRLWHFSFFLHKRLESRFFFFYIRIASPDGSVCVYKSCVLNIFKIRCGCALLCIRSWLVIVSSYRNDKSRAR